MPKTDSKGFVENAKSAVGSFHERVEAFFEERKKEANNKNAISLFIVSSIFLTLLIYLNSLDLAKINLFQFLQKNFIYLLKGLIGSVFSNGMAFLISAIVYFFVIKKFSTSKINFARVLYFYGMVVLFYAISNLLPDFFIVSVFASVSSLYLTLTAFKVLAGISYKKTVLISLAVSLLAGVLYYLFIFVSIVPIQILGLNNPPSYYYYNITTNPDGSITATYAWMLNSTNKPWEVCYVGFPKGWEEEDTTSEVEYEFIKKDSMDNPIAYFNFTWPMPAVMGRGYQRLRDSAFESKEKGEIFNGIFKIENVHYNISDNGHELLDIVMADESRSISRHKIDLITVSGLGYEVVYQAQYRKDSDLSYILNHSKCFKNDG